LKYGTDTAGNLCGTNNTGFTGAIDATSLPNIQWLKPWDPSSVKVCVASCTPDYATADAFKYITCTYGSTFSPTSNSNAAAAFQSASPPPCYWSLPSVTVLNRCIPKALVTVAANGATASTDATDTATLDLNARAVANEIWGDLIATWRIILM